MIGNPAYANNHLTFVTSETRAGGLNMALGIEGAIPASIAALSDAIERLSPHRPQVVGPVQRSDAECRGTSARRPTWGPRSRC